MNPNDPFGKGCNLLTLSDDQPSGVEHYTADGVYIRQIVVKNANSIIPQHSHVYDHMTMIVKGSVRIWKDGDLIGERTAPDGVFIPAHAKHAFLTLQDDTVLYCIHNMLHTGKIEIDEEHQILPEKLCRSVS